jgi:hypothetical protein
MRRTRNRSAQALHRLAPLLLGALGLLAVGFAVMQPAAGSGGSDEASAVSEGADSGRKLAWLEPEPAEHPTSSERPPAAVARQAPPPEARPAVQARGLVSGPGLAPPVAAAVNNIAAAVSQEGPFSVAVVPDEPELSALASALVERLRGHGLQARVAGLRDAGRPDALLLLGTGRNAAGNAWYCDPGPALSPVLAEALTPQRTSEEPEPPASLACDELHAGRARVPSVYSELPAGAGARPELAKAPLDALASGLTRFFQENSQAVRQARLRSPLAWPGKGPITSSYGAGHPLGIDIGQWQGNIIAALDGTVLFAGGDPCCGYGRYVVIESRDGIQTLYAHLDSLAVRKGQRVRQGQMLGRVGCTGRCSGTHLHFEVFEGGRRQNPMLYLP